MVAGLLLLDVLYLVGLVGLVALGSLSTAETNAALLAGGLAWPLALALALLAGALAWIAAVALVSALVPRPRPGRFKLMGHPVFFAWMVAFVLRRFLDVPPLRTLTFHSNVLRFLVMRLLGAQVHFTTSMSSDVLLLDPALFRAGPGCVLGAQAIVTGHLVLEGRVLLAPVTLGERVEIGARAMLAPGVTIGDDVRVGIAVSLGPKVTLEDGAAIGAHALLDAGVHVGKGARVLGGIFVPAGTEIEADAVYTGES